MTTFDKRKKSYENKFVHDKELQFKVIARRNRLLGEWAAKHLGLDEDVAKKYAIALVEQHIGLSQDEEVVNKVWSDFKEADLELDNHAIIREMKHLQIVARDDIHKKDMEQA